MGIMAMLLVMGAALFSNAGQGEGRQAVRSLVSGLLINAQNKALTSGEPVAVVMMPYESGREDQLGRAFTVFEVRQDDATGNFIAGRQERRWIELPNRFIFSKGDPLSRGGQNAFHQPPVVQVTVPNPKTSGRSIAEMPAIIFGPSGNVIWPAGSGELELHIGEGVIRNGLAVATGESATNYNQLEIFVIGRQTGRARILETE